MPWGWECRAKLVKQVVTKPTEKRVGHGEVEPPGPNHYEPPQIFCGKGYSRIKRSPAYSFGHRTPISLAKPAARPNAPMLNIQGLEKKGRYRITHSVVTPHIEPPSDKLKIPGPGQYVPQDQIRYKRSPAFSMRQVARPPYQAWDMWTPPPNMYLPPLPGKRQPAYTLGYSLRDTKTKSLLGPGEHDPKYTLVTKTRPAFSFGAPYPTQKASDTPAPNAYCEKKFMVGKTSKPAPSFGIQHSPYLGKQAEYLRSSKLDLRCKC